MPPTLLDVSWKPTHNFSPRAQSSGSPCGYASNFRTNQLTVRIVGVELLYRTGTGTSHFKLSHSRVGLAITEPVFFSRRSRTWQSRAGLVIEFSVTFLSDERLSERERRARNIGWIMRRIFRCLNQDGLLGLTQETPIFP